MRSTIGRTAFSTALVVLGVVALLGWLVCTMGLRAVEDDKTFASAASEVASSPVVRDDLSARASDQLLASLASSGVDVEGLGLDRLIRALTSAAVSTPAFQEGWTKATTDAHDQILAELTAKDRESAPVSVNVNVLALIEGQAGALSPVIEGALGDSTVAEVPVQIADAKQFDRWRTAYRVAEFGKRWFAIGGAVLILAGLLVSPRRRWFLPGVLGVLGVCAGGLAWWLRSAEARGPAETAGVAGVTVDLVTKAGLADLIPTITTVAWGSLGLAAVLVFIFLARSGRSTMR